MTTAYPNGQFFAEGNHPSWLPVPQGQVPIVYADFINGNYWYSGSAYSGFAAWVAATGGSFARSVQATYCGSLGLMQSSPIGSARFDYDPVTKHPLGIYLEPTFNNSILYSQTFSNAAWTKTNVTEADAAAIAPDGTTTGALITETGSGTIAHEVSQLLAGNFGCLSVYAKAGTGNFLNLAIDDGTANQYVQAVFDLSQGGITEYSTGVGAGTVTIPILLIEPAPDFGDGWYHCVLKILDNNTLTAFTYHVGVAAAAHGNTYSNTGQALYVSGGKTIFIWGAQVPSAPGFPLSYVATNSIALNSGGDKLIVGASWDNASNQTEILQEYDVRGININVTGTTNNGYYGVNQDSWYTQGAASPIVSQQPSGNTAQAFTGQVPGVNRDVVRISSTTVRISNNGNPVVISTAGAARTAATNIRLGGYESSLNDVMQMRLRVFAAWTNASIILTAATLQALSKVPGTPIVSIASTVDTGDPNWVGFPGFCVLPSGYLLVTYLRYHNSSQGAKPSQLMYQTAPSPQGPWSSQAVAIANNDSTLDLANWGPVMLPNGSILLMGDPETETGTTITATLYGVVGTETAPGVIAWGIPTIISGTPFFTGNNVTGGITSFGDRTASAPFLLPNGKWMQLIYGYVNAADPSQSVGAIFSTNPQDPTSWGSFTVIANGDAFTPVRSFSEANAFVDPSGNIVVIIRQENTVANGEPDYWRTVCPAGADPTVAANWKAPTFMAFNVVVGKPDVLGLGNNGMWLMTRGAIGANNLVGYNSNWNNGAAPFSGNRAAAITATFNNRQYWYSQSQILPGTGFIGSALGVDGPVQILFLQTQINGTGQSQ